MFGSLFAYCVGQCPLYEEYVISTIFWEGQLYLTLQCTMFWELAVLPFQVCACQCRKISFIFRCR
jgi:hypothetical protein